MLKKFCIFLLAATVAFLSTTAPTSVAFNATATTLPPVVLMNENVPAPAPTTVSVNLSFAIRPEAMDLIKTVSISSHELYGNYLVPLTMDLFDMLSAKCVELYEKFQTLAKDRFDTISAKIYEKAMDLMKTVSTSCHGLYKNYLVPLAMDLFEILSAKCEELYEKYEPLAKDRFNTISTGIYEKISSAIHPDTMDRIATVATNCQGLYKKYQPLALELFDTVSTNCHGFYKKYALAMDRITTIATNCHGFYKKYQPLAMELFDTVSTNCHGFYKKCQPLAMDLLGKMSTKCHGIYKKHLVPLAMNLISTGSTKCQEFYAKYLPLAMDCFHTILTQIYEKFVSLTAEYSVPYSLFDYGRIEMTAVPSDSILNRSVQSIEIAFAPLNFINVSGVGKMDEIVEIGSSMTAAVSKNVSEIVSLDHPITRDENITLAVCPARLSKNTTFNFALDDSKNMTAHNELTCDIQTAEMTKKLFASFSLEYNKKKNTTSAFHSKSNETLAVGTKNTTASLDSNWYMIFHENSTPTSMKETTTSDSLLDDFASIPSVAFDLAKDLYTAFCEKWEVFYDEYESFLPSWALDIIQTTKSGTVFVDLSKNGVYGSFGCIRTRLSFAASEIMATLVRRVTSQSISIDEEDLQDEVKEESSSFLSSAKSSVHGFMDHLSKPRTLLELAITPILAVMIIALRDLQETRAKRNL